MDPKHAQLLIASVQQCNDKCMRILDEERVRRAATLFELAIIQDNTVAQLRAAVDRMLHAVSEFHTFAPVPHTSFRRRHFLRIIRVKHRAYKRLRSF